MLVAPSETVWSTQMPCVTGSGVLLIGLFVSVYGLECLPQIVGALILVSGLLVAASGALLLGRKRMGAWVYLAALAFTYGWMLATSPLHPMRLLRALWFVPAIGLCVTAAAFVLPSKAGIVNRARTMGAMAVAIAIWLCVLALG